MVYHHCPDLQCSLLYIERELKSEGRLRAALVPIASKYFLFLLTFWRDWDTRSYFNWIVRLKLTYLPR